MNRRLIRTRSLLVACLSLVLIGLAAQGGAVAWSEETPIDWYLFQGIPPANARQNLQVAAIHMSIQWKAGYTIRSQGGQTSWVGTIDNYLVTNTMDPSLSWVIRDRASDAALEHEQCHFDISEVYRRKLEASISCIQVSGRTSGETQTALQQQLQSVGSQILARLAQIQETYDEETGHGTLPEQQALWEDRVRVWLDAPMTAP